MAFIFKTNLYKYSHGSRTTDHKNGFTLVEVIIALGILAIGLLGVISLQGVAIQGNMSAKDVMVATMLSNNRIDFFQSIPWAAPAGTANPRLQDTSLVVTPGGPGNNPAVFPNGYLTDPGNPYDSSGIPGEGPPIANPIPEGGHKYFVGWRIDDDPNNAGGKGNCLVPILGGNIDPSCTKAIAVRVQWLDGNILRHIEIDTIKTSGF